MKTSHEVQWSSPFCRGPLGVVREKLYFTRLWIILELDAFIIFWRTHLSWWFIGQISDTFCDHYEFTETERWNISYPEIELFMCIGSWGPFLTHWFFTTSFLVPPTFFSVFEQTMKLFSCFTNIFLQFATIMTKLFLLRCMASTVCTIATTIEQSRRSEICDWRLQEKWFLWSSHLTCYDVSSIRTRLWISWFHRCNSKYVQCWWTCNFVLGSLLLIEVDKSSKMYLRFWAFLKFFIICINVKPAKNKIGDSLPPFPNGICYLTCHCSSFTTFVRYKLQTCSVGDFLLERWLALLYVAQPFLLLLLLLLFLVNVAAVLSNM